MYANGIGASACIGAITTMKRLVEFVTFANMASELMLLGRCIGTRGTRVGIRGHMGMRAGVGIARTVLSE